jgi:lipopolysaccharide export system permease protein
MIGIIARYMSFSVVKHTTFVLLTLTSLVITFDLMERADNVLAATGGDEWAVLRYAWLRLPDALSRLGLVAVLVGALISFGLMMRHDELIAMWGSGVSAWGMMRALLPVALVFGGALLLLADRAVPWTMQTLREWNVVEMRQKSKAAVTEDATWLRSGSNIIRIPRDAARMGQLRDIAIFQRDPQGMLIERIDAQTVARQGEGWRLSGVTIHTLEPAEIRTVAELDWSGSIEVEHLALLSSDQADLSLAELMQLIENRGYGQRPTELFQTWLHGRLSLALGPLLVLCLVVALSQRFRRTGDFTRLLLLGMTIGFAFFVLDGATLAMGEAGLLPPWFAGWAAKLALLLLTGAIALQREG